ncbi:MAG TPA: maltose ABC transporter substrate-binding protein, partial [Terrimesophilobacter sp.]|nr:maltose ABC transporter substrate-binding protein [Terrimesophilobacter sp.]
MKVTSRNLVSAAAVSAVAALTLAGCTPAAEEPPAETTTLTVWVDAERVDALTGAAEAYSEATGVQVDVVSKDVATIKDDFIQQVPTGRGPD